MPALYRDRRVWWLAASIAASAVFYLTRGSLAGGGLIAAKALPVALLAAWAWSWRELDDARWLALVMAFGALGDGLIEIALQWGALAFFFGHVTAIALYLRHRRARLLPSQKGTVIALLLLTPVAALLLPADRATGLQAAVYAVSLGGMAASAWASAFPRYRVGAGAVLFVASDLLIFARLGPLAGSALPDLLISPLYHAGQALICLGVLGRLRSEADRA